MNLGTATVIQGDARHLPLADDTVDLIVTSPPYYALRSYTDGGQHYEGQIGDEPSPQEYLDNLMAVTAECVRVLKPTGSLFINLGDKTADRAGPAWAGSSDRLTGRPTKPRRASSTSMARRKSQLLLPERYRIRCVDELYLIARAPIVWDKPNGMPESVTDRVRYTHEHLYHFTLNEKYYSAIDTIREPHAESSLKRAMPHRSPGGRRDSDTYQGFSDQTLALEQANHPLGRLPGSVWRIPTEPLKLPDWLGVDHFAAYPTALVKPVVLGWSPMEVCTACGEGRRPVVESTHQMLRTQNTTGRPKRLDLSGDRNNGWNKAGYPKTARHTTITGSTCACPDTSAPTRPGVVLDPFGGTGTTALVGKALGRNSIAADRSADYCRVIDWRVNDRNQLAKVLDIPKTQQQPDDQLDILELLAAGGTP